VNAATNNNARGQAGVEAKQENSGAVIIAFPLRRSQCAWCAIACVPHRGLCSLCRQWWIRDVLLQQRARLR